MIKNIFSLLIVFMLVCTSVLAKAFEPVPSNVTLPAKYTPDYIDSISPTYKAVSNEQIFHVAFIVRNNYFFLICIWYIV